MKKKNKLVSSKGYLKGVTPYMMRKALFKVVGRMQRERVMSLFIKLGYLSKEQGAGLLNCTPEDVEKALTSLAEDLRESTQVSFISCVSM